jgi:hypothetical protein
VLYIKTYVLLWCLTEFFLEQEIFHTKAVENQNIHAMFNNFFSENCAIYEIMLRNMARAGQTTDDNTIRHVHFACWITKATDTLRIYNTYCSSMVTVAVLHLYILPALLITRKIPVQIYIIFCCFSFYQNQLHYIQPYVLFTEKWNVGQWHVLFICL